MDETVGLQNRTSEFEPRLSRQKVCAKCHKPKDEGEFNWKVVGKSRHSYCRECSNQSSKESYIANPRAYRERNKKRTAKIKELLDGIKSRTPCADCGGFFDPCAMDFDHLGEKKFYLAKAAGLGYSDEEIMKEIAKCEVVCANCHRVRTKNRRLAPSAVA